jgi:uroporphyrinogen-III synthase
VIQKFNVNVYSITSGESLEKLNNLLLRSDESQQYLRDIPVIVPSDRVYLQAEQFGFKNVKLANGADVKSTIIALQELDIEADKIDSD